MKKIMSCLALVALAVFTSGAFAQDQAPAQNPAPAQQPVVAQEPAPDQEPTLTSAEVKFDTTTDNKDQQTRLDVYMKTSHGHEVAKSEGNTGSGTRIQLTLSRYRSRATGRKTKSGTAAFR